MCCKKSFPYDLRVGMLQRADAITNNLSLTVTLYENFRYEYLVPYEALTNAALDGVKEGSDIAPPNRRTGQDNPLETDWHRSIQVHAQLQKTSNDTRLRKQ